MGYRKILNKFQTVRVIVIAFWAVFLWGHDLSAGENPGKQPPNIIIVSLMGLRNSESIDDSTHQYIPHLWNELRQEGTLYNNLIDVNKEFHMPELGAMISGKKYMSYTETLLVPSIAQRIRKKYKLPKTKFWEINVWGKNRVCLKDNDFGEDTYPCFIDFMGAWCSQEFTDVASPELIEFMRSYGNILSRRLLGHDIKAYYTHWDSMPFYEAFKIILKAYHPQYINYPMGDIDCAHFSTFSEYVLALKKSDQVIYEIWQMIRQDEFYKDNTYFIVIVDHSRDEYYMQHTENAGINRSHVWMYIYGPGIKKGKTIDRPIYHVDVFATLAYVADVNAQDTEGKVLEDALKKP